MTTVSNYRQQTRRKVTLCGGIVVEVRPLSVSDFLNMPDIPTAFISAAGRKVEASDLEKKVTPEFYTGLVRAALLNCIVGPADFKVVDKSPQDCQGNEIAFSEITPEDTSAIVTTVVAMSGLTKEAAENAKPFRAE